ncbi:4-hydroxy-tetrahydrodipicolinate reductase [Vulcanimicrobium alpinum]|uniref:4-hydroxy-tetrahydrodipicolinate reductase n=1 Tax=Vulcanimicrobium alpinum TaxID=3016050 RepID=A0AAN1XVV0_UNVUL|nr:dihydrodipicolinate reductase C-terminal domain-containing protein [Vulcanimicrobium alpinum]BDE05935.1 4-hydroxy-tetrahydrodipicolinate reductase [Vulcanimicrobium alpinum]
MRVGVAGALGRLGRVACAAIEAANEMTLAAVYTRRGDSPLPHVHGFEDLDAFVAAGLDVIVDCTVYPATVDVARAALDSGISPVIGATGWTDEDLLVLADRCDDAGIAAMFVPNFSFGAALMMRFAAQAARVMPRAEIVELHHETKRDAPSGTAKLTARRIHDAGAPLPAIHSVRLPGLVAHQETIFGGIGETLTLRHDSLARDSFGPGIVAAVRAVRTQPPGLTVGLDAVVERMLA